jgi:hypothetical protein
MALNGIIAGAVGREAKVETCRSVTENGYDCYAGVPRDFLMTR